MRISTKGRYATRLMLDLALHYNGSYIPLKTISQRQNISDKYLEQIITLLSRADYVKSARGAQGGYMLTRDPATYTVGDILRTTEGSLAPVACLDNARGCEMAEACVSLEIWLQIEEAINNVVDNITLADLVDRYYEKNGDADDAMVNTSYKL